jgi:methylglyoxal synthase
VSHQNPAQSDRDTLSSYMLYTSGTTGTLIARELDLKRLYFFSKTSLATPTAVTALGQPA